MRVPLLVIHAKDDPIVSDLAAPYQEIMQNKYAVMVATSGGGHLSWFELGGGRWFARAAAAWLNKMANSVDLDAVRQTRADEPLRNGRAGIGSAKAMWNPVQRKLDDNAV